MLFVAVVMMACKDDPKLSTTDLLTKPVNGWVRTSTMVTVGGVQKEVFNDPTFTPDCKKDDATVFLADGTYQLVSTVKCSSVESSILDSGTWSLDADQKTITIMVGGNNQTETILEIDETHLKANLILNISGIDFIALVTMVPK